MKTKHHCVQCGKELVELSVCILGCQNPACSNYALLAKSIEEMPKEK